MESIGKARPAGFDDLDAVVALVNRESLRFSGEAEFSATELRQEWTEPGSDLATDTRVALRTDGSLIAYADYFNNREPHVRPFCYCCVDPDELERIDWSPLLDWILERAQSDLEKAPGDLRFTVLTGSPADNVRMLDSWRSRGFTECRRFYSMKIEFNGPPPPPAIPGGYEIRPMRADEERDVYDAMAEAFSDHYGFVPPPDPETGFKRWKHHFFESEEHRAEMMLIATTRGGEIAGASLSKPNHGEDGDMGWVNSLAVCADHRRKGLGEALLRESFGVMFRMGKKRAGLGVDAESITNATRLYEKSGMNAYSVFVQMEKILRDGRELANLGES
jgi:ribosomal protein S18 acetylase RimI-like enzyme